MLSEKSSKLKFRINKPYTFQIVTKEKTKIYISYDNDEGKRLEACNIIAPKDSLLKFENNNNIRGHLKSYPVHYKTIEQ